MTSLPSYINPELNLDPPSAINHMESDDEDDDNDNDNENDNDNRYELWTVRIPVGMKIDELNGVEINLKALQTGRMELNNGKYVLSQGESNENETFRVLVPDGDDSDDDSSNSDSNSNSNSNKFLLHPSRKGFSRHFNVHKNILERKTEAELAPSKGPDPIGCTLKHSYSHIPQRKGLKRRWMPLGNKQGAIAIDPKFVTLKAEKVPKTENNTDKEEDEDEDVSPVKQEKTKSSSKKRRRSNSSNGNHKQPQESATAAAAAAVATTQQEVSPKKKKRSKSKDQKTEKKAKKGKKSKKKVKNEHDDDDDAISV